MIIIRYNYLYIALFSKKKKKLPVHISARKMRTWEKNDDERVWGDLYHTEHTFEVHVCVVLLAFTKLCFNFQPNLNLINRLSRH